MSVLDKLKKNTSKELSGHASSLEDASIFRDKELIPTPVPALNIALSGRVDGGLGPGHTMLAGPSKHFKSGFALLMVKSYLDRYPDGACLFYNNEFGMPLSYFQSFGIDMSRVWHVPFMNVEQLKTDLMGQVTQLTNKDNVIIIVDSIGNAASKKETDDALEGKSVADMTRAKSFKSLFRMVTPYLPLNDIPLVTINHTYKTLELYSKDVVGGGTGSYYSADNIFIIGRQQEKDGKDTVGYNFIINIEKSRYVQEKSKIPVEITYENGISKWSGLIDMALKTGHVIKPSNGWYQRVDMETGEIEDKKYRYADTQNKAFWNPILTAPTFKEAIEKMYSVSHGDIMSDEDDVNMVLADIEED